MKRAYRRAARFPVTMDPTLVPTSKFRAKINVDVPLLSRPISAIHLHTLQQAYSISVNATLSALQSGLSMEDYRSIHPMDVHWKTSYPDRSWAGWSVLEKWRPIGPRGIAFKKFFGKGFLEFSVPQQKGIARSLAAIAAGISRGLSTLALHHDRDHWGSVKNTRDRPSLEAYTRIEVVKNFRITRVQHNRIHLNLSLLRKTHDVFGLARALLHEASHAYAATMDFYYYNSSASSDFSAARIDIGNSPSLSQLTEGADLTQEAFDSLKQTGKPDPDFLTANADTLAYFILHIGR